MRLCYNNNGDKTMIKVTLTNEIVKRILKIEENKINIGNVDIPISISNKLRKSSKKKSSYASNKIEGNPLSEIQADKAIESNNRHFLKPEQEIRNYYNALNLLEKRVGDKQEFSLDLILEVQKEIVSGSGKEKEGIRGEMPPGVLFAVYDDVTRMPEYIPPEHTDVLPLLNELVTYVHDSDDHPIIKAAIVHYQLVTIHHFEDGNGRTARLMSDYVLDYYGYGFNKLGSLEEYFAYDIDEYYSSIQMGLPVLYYDGRNNPPHPEIWINYFLRMMELYSSKVLELSLSSIENTIEGSVSHLNVKEKNFLKYILNKNINDLIPIELSKKLNVTNRTIVNWCSKLSMNGFLIPNLVNKRIRSYSITEFVKNNKKEIIRLL